MPKRVLVLLIRIYKFTISPYLGNCCRFYPSCSEYAVIALEKKGFLKGVAYAVWRILRCNPFSKGGNDDI